MGNDALGEHLEAGRFVDARTSAERALKEARRLGEGQADAEVLCGAIANAEGDVDAARAAYERAMKLDPELSDPILLAAELEADLGEFARAVKLCERALDLAEEEEEFVDALLLKAEIELASDDQTAARATLDELPPLDEGVLLPLPAFHLRAGDLFLRLEAPETADRHFAAAGQSPEARADGRYGQALCAEAREDREAMIRLFLEVHALDGKAPREPWAPPAGKMEELIEAALGELPDKARELLGNVPILLEDRPSEAQVKEGLDPRLLGLFAGIPYPEQSNLGGQPPHLEHITLYQRNLERAVDCAEDLEDEVRTTLLHETGHFFGLDEDDLAAIGLD